VKFRKIYLIILFCITLLCMGAGILFYFVPDTLGMFQNNTALFQIAQNDKTGNADTFQNVSTLSAFQNVSVNIDVSDLTFCQGDQYGLTINAKGKMRPQFYVKNETLYIEQKEIGFFNMSWFRAGQKNQIIVTIPAGKTLNDFTLQSDTGNVTLKNIAMEGLNCSLDTGDLNVENVQAKTSSLDLDTGAVTCSKSELGQLTATCDTGKIVLTDTKTKDTDISCDTGDVQYTSSEGADSYYYKIESDMGGISVNGAKCGKHYDTEKAAGKYKMEINCSTGSVDLKLKTY